jgi:hypothetical protein
VLPVEIICFASVDDIVKAAAPLVASAFPASPALKFAVQLELRSCDGLKLDRKSVVDALAALVPAPHTVDLSSPDRVLMVQVIKNSAALAILSDYYALCKYNLRCVFKRTWIAFGAKSVSSQDTCDAARGASGLRQRAWRFERSKQAADCGCSSRKSRFCGKALRTRRWRPGAAC